MLTCRIIDIQEIPLAGLYVLRKPRDLGEGCSSRLIPWRLNPLLLRAAAVMCRQKVGKSKGNRERTGPTQVDMKWEPRVLLDEHSTCLHPEESFWGRGHDSASELPAYYTWGSGLLPVPYEAVNSPTHTLRNSRSSTVFSEFEERPG